MMVLLLGVVVANVTAGFLFSIGSINASIGWGFGCLSMLFWFLLRDQQIEAVATAGPGVSAGLITPPADIFASWSNASNLDFSENLGDSFNEVISGPYRYRVQFIAWPPTIGETCSQADLELFLGHLNRRKHEKILVLTQLNSKATIASITELSTAYRVTLVSDVESQLKRETLPESSLFHRILIFGPAEKRVRWEIALHRIFGKSRNLSQKTESSIQI